MKPRLIDNKKIDQADLFKEASKNSYNFMLILPKNTNI